VRPLTWAIFTPPKPFNKSPAQYAALFSWTTLRVPPTKIYLVEADDLDDEEMEEVVGAFGRKRVERLKGRTNPDGLLLVRNGCLA